MTPESGLCITVESHHLPCQGQNIAGDVFLSRKLEDGNRVVSVLSDGLGSGVEAATLASLTASMAQEYVGWSIDTAKAATILMDSLPVEARRRISYSTFTIVDARTDGRTRVFEHGNPPFILVREGQAVPLERRVLESPRWGNRQLAVSEFEARMGDRLILWSDGVTQSGIGSDPLPLGWGEERALEFLLSALRRHPDLPGRKLSEMVVERSTLNDGGAAGDDITCGVVDFRTPRCLCVLSGPPYDMSRDREFAEHILEPGSRKVVCGGTTANIVSRELGREVDMDLGAYDREVPMASTMEGAELVTEGCLTLGKAAEYLEEGLPQGRRNAATRLVRLFLDSDVIRFLVGTRVNEAHQDPALPIELDIRRNVIKRIASLLEKQHLKRVEITYF